MVIPNNQDGKCDEPLSFESTEPTTETNTRKAGIELLLR